MSQNTKHANEKLMNISDLLFYQSIISYCKTSIRYCTHSLVLTSSLDTQQSQVRQSILDCNNTSNLVAYLVSICRQQVLSSFSIGNCDGILLLPIVKFFFVKLISKLSCLKTSLLNDTTDCLDKSN